MDWLLHPSPVPRPTPKRHGNYGGINNKTRAKIAEARDGTAQQQDSRFLRSEAWLPLPGSVPVPLETRTGCCWPCSDTTPHLFCNEPVPSGSKRPYCPDHLQRYYSPKETK